MEPWKKPSSNDAKAKVTGNENVKLAFSLKSASKMDRFTTNQDQNENGHRPILQISTNTFRQRKCFVIVIICNYPGGRHVAAANWSCTYF